jgi:hypothetical protein
VASSGRKRAHTWHFSDASARFANSNIAASRDRQAISPTFSRKIIRCRRCGSRIIANAKRCPYCGKRVQPFYRSLLFWCFIVAVLAAVAVYGVFFFHPASQITTTPQVQAPLVIGRADQQNLEGLPLGTTVDCNSLLVSAISVSQSSTTSDGVPIYKVDIQFVNKGPNSVSLLSTQWMMRSGDASTHECFTGKDAQGNNLDNALEGKTLAPGENTSVSLYFAAPDAKSVLFLVDSLNLDTKEIVSWNTGLAVNTTPPAASDEAATEDAAAEEGAPEGTATE